MFEPWDRKLFVAEGRSVGRSVRSTVLPIDGSQYQGQGMDLPCPEKIDVVVASYDQLWI